jgi:DNA-binding transcriptional ArsR family regulator
VTSRAVEPASSGARIRAAPPGKAKAATGLAGAAPVFAALGEPMRLGIVARLCDRGPLSIARLTEGSRISRQAVTKHLRVLESAGVVLSGRNGRERIWQIQAARLSEARRCLDAISLQWDDALQRLQAFVESGGPQ